MENGELINNNCLRVSFDAISENEMLARVITAAFITSMNPTIEELSDIKTAVSEAVTNAIVHGYDKKTYNTNGSYGTSETYNMDAGGVPQVHMKLVKSGNELTIEVVDFGVGIEDIEKAKEPLYTTKPEQERTGMGFVFMEVFMEKLEIISKPSKGTKIIMKKIING